MGANKRRYFMGKQQHIDNDIVKNVSDNIDNDIVRGVRV